MGWQNIPYRVQYEIQRRSGFLKQRTGSKGFSQATFQRSNQLPNEEVLDRWQQARKRFFITVPRENLKTLVSVDNWHSCVGTVNAQAIAGRYTFFSRWRGDLDWPPKFNWDPVNHINWPSDQHWARFCRSGPPRNDIKLVWEPSRLSLAYYLARDYQYSGDAIHAEHFWELFNAFVKQSPPNYSAAWGCGQEVAWRIFALLFAAFTTLDSSATTSERLASLELLCWQSAKRIAATTAYAISQNNNHSISEAVGLWTISIIFPWFRESSAWKTKAEKILAREVKDQVDADGSYAQHSTNYHRVFLDNLSWLISLAKLNNIVLDEVILEKHKLATEWLEQIIELDSGHVPNLGCNDSSWLLPLSCSDITDFRPALQTAALVAFDQTVLPPGVWDEQSMWLNQSNPNKEFRHRQKTSWNAWDGGYHILRNRVGKILIRACQLRSRPAQNDNLHVDIWHRGINLIGDAGSYRYYDDSPKTNDYFNSVVAHNTVQFSNDEQMQKGPGFQWFCWPKIIVNRITDFEILCELYSAVTKDAVHRRRIKRHEDSFEIQDAIEFDGLSTVRWRLNPHFIWKRENDSLWSVLCGREKLALSLLCENPDTVFSETLGYVSDYYGKKRTCKVLEVTGPLTELTTVLGPHPQQVPMQSR